MEPEVEIGIKVNWTRAVDSKERSSFTSVIAIEIEHLIVGQHNSQHAGNPPVRRGHDTKLPRLCVQHTGQVTQCRCDFEDVLRELRIVVVQFTGCK